MERYKETLHENQNNENLKWCICVCGTPDLTLGLFDTLCGATQKAEEMSASFVESENWIKSKGTERVEIDTNHSEHIGPIVKLDKFHVIQKLGRHYAAHRVDKLDNKVLMLDDSSTGIKYREGRGTVTVCVEKRGMSR